MSNKLIPPAPPQGNPEMEQWLELVRQRVGFTFFPVKGYSRTDLPAASDYESTDRTFMIYVHDATGGASLAYSNGTNWISVITGAAV